jgi:hypothetical protein
MTFLVRLLEMELPGSGATGDHAVRAALLPRAPALVRLLLAGAAGALPPARNPQIASVLFALVKVCVLTRQPACCPVACHLPRSGHRPGVMCVNAVVRLQPCR